MSCHSARSGPAESGARRPVPWRQSAGHHYSRGIVPGALRPSAGRDGERQHLSRPRRAERHCHCAQCVRGKPISPQDDKHKRATAACDPYHGSGRYAVVQRFVEKRDWQEVIATLKQAKLRGMGGAGFPTGLKWEIVRNAASATKSTSCATPMRASRAPSRTATSWRTCHTWCSEGMIVAGLVTGARKGILYIRHEYETREAHPAGRDSIGCYREWCARPAGDGQRPVVRSGDFRQPRRIHLRRRKRVAGSHRGQACGAAQQAAVSRNDGLWDSPPSSTMLRHSRWPQ